MDSQSQQSMQRPDKKLQADISEVLGHDAPASQQTGPFSAISQPQPAHTNKPGDPKKPMTDADAQALLATFNMQNPKKPEKKLPMGMLITIATLIVIVIIASVTIGAINSKGKTNSSNLNSSGSSNQSSGSNDNTSKQINNDVQSCQNPGVAVSEC